MRDIKGLRDIARLIDHSLLHPTMTDAQIKCGCDDAIAYGVAAACVKPYAVAACQKYLVGTKVAVCSVVAFPHGNHTVEQKINETRQALLEGASEIDMVVNVGKVLGGNWDDVRGEIASIQAVCQENNALLKVIFETDYLEDHHIIRLCEICSHEKVAFVKTSTGFATIGPGGPPQGATPHVIFLMRKHSSPDVQIKASGGIKTLDKLLDLYRLGATRIGVSATGKLLEEAAMRGYT